VAAWLEYIFKRAPDLAIETTCTCAGGQLNNVIRSVEPIKSMHYEEATGRSDFIQNKGNDKHVG
jgi:hypothetical protein